MISRGWKPFLGGLFALHLVVLGCGSESARDEEEAIGPAAAAFLASFRAAYDTGSLNQALTLADSAEAAQPGLAATAYSKGLVLNRLRRYDEAGAAFRQALERNPNLPQVRYNLGHTAFLQRRYREALDAYQAERALVVEDARREPALLREVVPTIDAQIGRTFEKMGVPDSARMSYEAALKTDSTLAVAHAWLSELDENEGRVDTALEHARQALVLAPYDLNNVYRAGLLLLLNGRAGEAVPLLTAVVQRWPGHEGATYNLGRALTAIGEEAEGQKLLDRVEDIQRLQEEALVAERGVETYPTEPGRWITLADLMMQIGYLDKAEEALSAALTLKPGDLSLQSDLANLAASRGDTSSALIRFQTLLKQDSTFADGWVNLGVLYAMLGREDEARRAWRTALRHNPTDAQTRTYLDRLDHP